VRKLSPLAKSGLFTGSAIAAALVLAAGTANASGSWTVTGGGSFSATSTNSTLTDPSTGTQLKCTTSTANGGADNAVGRDGNQIAHIDSITWASCSGPLGITFTVTAKNLPWYLNAVSYSAPIVTGTLTGVEASIGGFGCTADFGGAGGAGTPATLDVQYNNTTHTLTVLGTGDLTTYNVSGTCLGLLNNNDVVSYKGDYPLNPATLNIVPS